MLRSRLRIIIATPGINAMRRAVLGLLAALASNIGSAALAADIHVMTGGAPKEVLAVLTPEFEKQTGHKVRFTYAVISAIQQKLTAGEKPDMVLMPVPAIEARVKDGTFRGDARREIRGALQSCGDAERRTPHESVGAAWHRRCDEAEAHLPQRARRWRRG